jgi:sulfatase modifying factor 1
MHRLTSVSMLLGASIIMSMSACKNGGPFGKKKGEIHCYWLELQRS